MANLPRYGNFSNLVRYHGLLKRNNLLGTCRASPCFQPFLANAPDIQLAADARGRVQAAGMANRLAPIDDLIDALVWMRRKARVTAAKRRRTMGLPQ
jgi:hypothetical protein